MVDRENIGIKIFGNNILKGTDVKALDIRCGAALIIAANSAEGITNIHNANQIKGDMKKLIRKLNCLEVFEIFIKCLETDDVKSRSFKNILKYFIQIFFIFI